MRVSLGYDRHRLVPDDCGIAVVAGVPFKCGFSVIAHSDGDVVMHAVADAISSVFLKKTIGELFPDDDERWKGRESSFFLKETYALSGKPAIGSLDVIVISDQVMLRGSTEAMCSNLAGVFGMDAEKVSIKGRRREDAGACPAIECICSILFA